MDRNEQKNNFQNVQNKRKRETKKGGVGGILTVIAVVVLAVCIGVLGWQLNVSSSRISKQSVDIKELRTKIANLEAALTPEPTATPEPTQEPTPTPEEASEPPAGVSKDDQGIVTAYDEAGNSITIESSKDDGTIKVYDANKEQKYGDLLYDEKNRAIAFDANGSEIRVGRDDNAKLVIYDVNGEILYQFPEQ